MAMSPQEEEDLKKRILALEEEKERAKKSNASKEEIAAAIAPILAELRDARKELSELKAQRRSNAGPAAHEDDPGDICDMTEPEETPHE